MIRYRQLDRYEIARELDPSLPENPVKETSTVRRAMDACADVAAALGWTPESTYAEPKDRARVLAIAERRGFRPVEV